MIVEFRSNKLKKQCENPDIAQKDYGARIGTKLTQRVGELKAAKSLLEIKKIPAARLHRLQGPRSDQYAVDLVHPYRLVFKPLLEDGEDINQLEVIDVIRIEEMTDYHGKQKRK